MKKYIIFLLIIMTSVSCEEYLDRAPDFGLDESDVFNNYISVRGYLDHCYNLVNDFSVWSNQGMGRAHVSQMSDEAANPYTSTSIANRFNKGLWLGATNASEVGWGNNDLNLPEGRVIPKSFLGMRICNKVIEKAPIMSSLTGEQKNQILGQAHFLRGWFYFELIRRLGGMPLIDLAYNPDDDADMERMSYRESTYWIIEQMDQAIELLPDEWPANETGRPEKSAAYALKEWATLYAASPLMNNPVGLIADNGYDIETAKLAAQYAKEALDYINTKRPVHNMMPGDQYKHIFYHAPKYYSDESLWYLNSTGRNRDNPPDLAIHWQNVEFSNRKGNYGQAVVCPTQNMVDLYETSNGYPVRLVGNEWITGDPDFDPSIPFENRDPRLGMTIIVPGEEFGVINNKPNYLCTWEGGRDIEPVKKPNETVRTGYLCKKWQWPETVDTRGANNKAGYSLYSYNCIHIRTTQIWLDYAEAMNEAYGPNEKPAGYTYSAVDAINRVRSRVGMTAVKANFTTDKETFRDRIRNERAVELMFENHRWFDLRRWMIAEKVFNPAGDAFPIKGVTAVGSALGKTNNKNKYTDVVLPGNTFTYQLKDVTEEIRVFEKKHYWYPIGKDEAERYVFFKQNPGW